MRLVKFRIKNYKSIVDSGDCYVTDTVTIFAGKNEAGKTAILEALEDFSSDDGIRKGAQPIVKSAGIPTITVTLKVSQEEVTGLLSLLGKELKVDREVEVEITRNYKENYEVSWDSLDEFSPGLSGRIEEVREKIQDLEKWILATAQENTRSAELDGDDHTEPTTTLAAVRTQLVQGVDEELNAQVGAEIEELDKRAATLRELEEECDKLFEALIDRTPSFILFSSFEDVFPNTIPMEEFDSSKWIKDLKVVSNLDVETIRGGDDRDQKDHKNRINLTLNDRYERYWSQGDLELSVDWNDGKLMFWVEEHGVPYAPGQRSKGHQWHLAFFIRVSAQAGRHGDIILIDEPGLYLHAQAQQEVLRMLEDMASETQILFTSHSPFLMAPDRLDRVRPVVKQATEGTKIQNNIHGTSDKETLTPLMAAIGMDFVSGIVNVDKHNNVVVEGVSDCYYLQALNELCGDKALNFLFGGGAGNVGIVGSILEGLGSRVRYLLDNDSARKSARKSLVKKWDVPDQFIETLPIKGGAIEDVFGKADFKQWVLRDSSVSYDVSNSDYVRQNSLKKIVLARRFLDLVRGGGVNLRQNTVRPARKIIQNLERSFGVGTETPQ